MTEDAAAIVGAGIGAALWLAWALFSETRHNHGFWVALLLPLALVLMPLLWVLFLVFKYSSYLVFVMAGRRAGHGEFIRRLKRRCGVFL